jgi:tetratricopeptide (TPR) repeat protein
MSELNSDEKELLIQELQEDLAKTKQQNDPKATCLALEKLGQAYLDDKEAPDALTQFEEALKILKGLDDRETRARLLGEKGLALKLLGNGSLALQAFRESKGIASNLKHDLLLCDSDLQIGMLRFDKGEQTEALEDMTQALEIATRRHDNIRKLRIAGVMADCLQALGQSDKAQDYFSQAYETAQALGDRAAECTLLMKMGNLSLAAGETKTAIERYEHSLEIASDIGNRSAEINILGGLFRANALAKNLDLAATYGEKVVQLADEIHHFDAEIANIHVLASFLIDQAQYSKALAYLDQGRRLAEQNHNQEWLLTLESTSGTAHYRAGENAAAIEAYKRASKLAARTADKQSEARILGFLSAVQADQGLLDEAIKSAEHALELASGIHDHALAAESQMLLAFGYRDQDKADRAIQACQAAIASYKKIGNEKMVEKAESLLVELQG